MKDFARYMLGRGKKKKKAPGTAFDEKPKILIFDFDGTIADTFQAGHEILNSLAEKFKFRPLKSEDLEKARDMRTRDLMKFLGIRMHRMHRIARHGAEAISKRIDAVESFPGVPEALRELHRRGYTLGIITSNTEANVNVFLKRHDLEIFSFIRSSSKLMGKAREIKAVIKKCKLEPEDLYCIGDEIRDVEAAQKAGIRIGAVLWGYNSRRALEALEPSHLFHTPADILVQFP